MQNPQDFFSPENDMSKDQNIFTTEKVKVYMFYFSLPFFCALCGSRFPCLVPVNK